MNTMLHVEETYDYQLLLGEYARTIVVTKRGWVRLRMVLIPERFDYLLNTPGPNHLGDLYFLIRCPENEGPSPIERHGFALTLPADDALAADIKNRKDLSWHFLFTPEAPNLDLIRAQLRPVSDRVAEVELMIMNQEGKEIRNSQAGSNEMNRDVLLNQFEIDCTYWTPSAEQFGQIDPHASYDRLRRRLVWPNRTVAPNATGQHAVSLRCPIPIQTGSGEKPVTLQGSAIIELQNTLGSGRSVILRPASEEHNWIQGIPVSYTTKINIFLTTAQP